MHVPWIVKRLSVHLPAAAFRGYVLSSSARCVAGTKHVHNAQECAAAAAVVGAKSEAPVIEIARYGAKLMLA